MQGNTILAIDERGLAVRLALFLCDEFQAVFRPVFALSHFYGIIYHRDNKTP
nr:MAG TPA: hypothetical protein [Caudoviricetes sp.]